MPNPAEQLASFVAGLTYDDLPPGVRQRVAEITVDTLASAIAGRHGDETAQIERLADAVGGQGDSTVLGGPRRMAQGGAVLVNGYQVTAVTVCDVFRPALCHVTPEVVPPALAVAERRGSSGRELLTAIAAGLETTTRVGFAVDYPAFRRRGWHSPGVIGPFGGAAAVGSLLRLDAGGLRHALGLAGSQSAGTFAHWGTPTIKFHQSRGALSGLLAGQLAAQGFLSAEEIFTNPDGGLLHAYTDGGRPEALTDELGRRWDLETIALRRWPAASSVQTMITGLFALIERHDLQPKDLAEVAVRLSPTVYRMHGSLPWTSKFSAQLSAPYLAAVVLHDRRCWLDQFLPSRFGDPDLDAFARERVVVSEDPGVEGTASVIRVRLHDGTTYEDVRSIPKGDPSDPLSMTEIVGKFREASEGILADAAVERALELLLDLESVDDVSGLIRLLGTG
jgi:2-methylcitrate dehydratase PrpD